MSDESGNKKTVNFSITARAELRGEVELTQAEHDQWIEKIDNARGFERERVAHELAELAGIDWRQADISDDEVEEFDWKELSD